jgi:hypothetical protein
MGEFTVTNAGASTAQQNVAGTVPPQAIARWATIAAERALVGFLPHQAKTA